MSRHAPPPPLQWPHYGIGFGGAVRRGFAKYATFSGRASRGEYWWWTLFTFVTALGLGIPAAVLGILTSPDGGETPGAPVTVRRLHDAGYSGWLVLLTFIPWLGGLILLVFTVIPASPNGARYDPAPPAYGYPYGYPPG